MITICHNFYKIIIFNASALNTSNKRVQYHTRLHINGKDTTTYYIEGYFQSKQKILLLTA